MQIFVAVVAVPVRDPPSPAPPQKKIFLCITCLDPEAVPSDEKQDGSGKGTGTGCKWLRSG